MVRTMSVLIKGMELPESCEDCRFCAGLADTEWGTCAGCLIDDEYREASSKSGCPLVEVPAPHGRLIDADRATAESIKRTGKRLLAIDTAPTIIEAERSEDA